MSREFLVPILVIRRIQWSLNRSAITMQSSSLITALQSFILKQSNLSRINTSRFVCSFKSPKEKGTSVGNFQATKPLVPCFIYKTITTLISISAKDFFLSLEASLHKIFGLFADLKLKLTWCKILQSVFQFVSIMILFKIPELLEELKKTFQGSLQRRPHARNSSSLLSFYNRTVVKGKRCWWNSERQTTTTRAERCKYLRNYWRIKGICVFSWAPVNSIK